MPVYFVFGFLLVPACVALSSSPATDLTSCGAGWVWLSLPVLSCGCATPSDYEEELLQACHFCEVTKLIVLHG